jgi:hypothetical protein
MDVILTESQVRRLLIEQKKPNAPVYLTSGDLVTNYNYAPESYVNARYAKDVFPYYDPKSYPKKINSAEIYFAHDKDGKRISTDQFGIGTGSIDSKYQEKTKAWNERTEEEESQKKIDKTKREDAINKGKTIAGKRLSYSLGTSNDNPDEPEIEKQRRKKFKDENPQLQEPESKRNVSVTCKLGGRKIPKQTESHYYDEKNDDWVLKSEKNISDWRCAPSGFYPAEYAKYLEETKYLTKPKIKTTSFGGNTTVDPDKEKREQILKKYYDANFPFGQPSEKRTEFYTTQKQIYRDRDEKLQSFSKDFQKFDGMIASMRQEAKRNDTTLIIELSKNSIKNLESQYGYWKAKETDGGYDWITLVGFALYLCPYTAAFAPYFTSATELTKAAESLLKGNYQTAAFETLFTLLPLTKFGQSGVEALSGVKAMQKLATGGLLSQVEKQGLATLGRNSNTIKDELLQASKDLVSKLPEKISNEAEKWTSSVLKKGFSDLEEKLSGYEEIKKNLVDGAKKNDIKEKTKT